MNHATLFGELRDRVVALDLEGVRKLTTDALELGIDPREIISKGLAPGMQVIGEGYEEGRYFVPELLLSAKAMHGAIDLLKPHLLSGTHARPGVVVIGTVQGDVHQIGKDIVAVVLEGNGFEIHDLGEDVPPARFVSKAMEVDADVVGMSALISTAVSKMVETAPAVGSPAGYVDAQLLARLWADLESAGKAETVRAQLREVTAVRR